MTNNMECGDNGPIMCAFKNLTYGLFSENSLTPNSGGEDEKSCWSTSKWLYLFSFVITILFITELWVNMLRALNDQTTLGKPRFCFLGFRCYL